jgi:hypothetical protein
LERLHGLLEIQVSCGQDIGKTGHLEKLDFRRDWNLEETGHLRANHLEKQDSRRNGTPGVTQILERLDP